MKNQISALLNSKNQSKWLYKAISFITILMVIGLVVFVAWGIIVIVKDDNAIEIERTIQNQTDTVYSLQHPEIVGTNENGEVVKRYYDYTHGATIYEIGKTKTEVIHRGKLGTSTNVSVEQQ